MESTSNQKLVAASNIAFRFVNQENLTSTQDITNYYQLWLHNLHEWMSEWMNEWNFIDRFGFFWNQLHVLELVKLDHGC